MVYAYTGGVTEAMDAEGGLFGEERLLETLGKHEGDKACTICEKVGLAVASFTEGAEQSDDITMLSLCFGMSPRPQLSS